MMQHKYTLSPFSLLAILGLGLMLLVLPGAAWGQVPQANGNPDVGIDQKLDAQAPLDTVFTDENGKSVKLGTFFGKRPVVLLMPFYKCAGMCTLEIDGLVKACNAIQFTAGKEFDVVVLSIDPKEKYTLAASKKRETLDSYPRPEAAGGWHFLTGEEEQTRRLARAVGFRYVIDPKTRQPIHSVGLILLTPKGRVSRYMLGVDYAPRSLRLALVDASENRIGGLVDQIVLLCTHYDPTTSRFGVAIDRIIKVTCGMTVLLLGTFLFAMFRMEKQRADRLSAPKDRDAPPDL
jgi:protein SCO1/2